jgi:type I restriction enzyme S subunit
MSTATTHIETDKELVPEIRFEGFDGGIVEYLFNDIFLFSTGKSIKQKEASPEFETPCVRYGELYHMYNEVINEVINKTNLEKSELRFSKGDEILLPSAGEDPLDIGSASALTLKNVAIGRTINILRPMKVDVYSQIFASYYINQKLRKKISTLAKGSSISNVYNSDLKTLKINLPSLPEQQKIASFLAALDDKIQQLTKKKALLEQYKKGGLQQLFSGQLRFKDENGNHYPDWEEKELDEIAIFRRGKNILASEKGHNYLLGMGAVSESGKLLVNKKTEYDDDFLLKNDLVMPERDIGVGLIIGRVARIDENDKYILGANILSLTINESCVPDYVYYQINDFRFRRKMNRLVNGSAQLMITSKEVKRLGINLPFIEEQQKIATYLSGIDTKIESVNHQITQTQAFKKGLLQQMFV